MTATGYPLPPSGIASPQPHPIHINVTINPPSEPNKSQAQSVFSSRIPRGERIEEFPDIPGEDVRERST